MKWIEQNRLGRKGNRMRMRMRMRMRTGIGRKKGALITFNSVKSWKDGSSESRELNE